MKFLQLNMNSTNASLNELWRYQKENNYGGIFLQETKYTDERPLGNLKHWKSKMHTIYKSKTEGFGDGTLIPISTKNVFRDDYINNDLEIIWNETNIQNKDVVITNICVTPGKESQLKILNKKLERHRGKNNNY